MSVSSTTPALSAVARRAHWLRLFALMVSLLGLAAQQRVLTPVVRPSSSVVRLVAERTQSIESHAVRADPAARVAAAPTFARVPLFSVPLVTWPRVVRDSFFSAPRRSGALAAFSHFHSKRRIPRMNSEEPPRA